MGFSRSFTVRLIAWTAALLGTLLLFAWTLATPGLGAARIVALSLVAGVAVALWGHVAQTNFAVARFLETLRFGDYGARFEGSGDAGFATLGAAFDSALGELRRQRDLTTGELRFRDALIDDIAVALLTIDGEGRIMPANKAARALFRQAAGARAEDYAAYGATFARRLASADRAGEEVLLLTLDGRPQRAIVRQATLDRLGGRVRAVTVQPIQGTLDAVEMAAQTDIVRVLTHEILNSLTPVTSLAATAATLLEGAAPADLVDAKVAVATLARRAEGLTHFIESYRTIARPPVVARESFAAEPFADELARLFAADWPAVSLVIDVRPQRLAIDADRGLMAQVMINLLRNAAEAASSHGPAPQVALAFAATGDGHVAIEVADNGPGVPETLRSDVFLPFFTTRKAGTGVGLNLARQVVVAHGGTIDIGDAAIGGACFRILM